METEQIRFRMAKDQTARLRKLSDKCGIAYTDLIAVFIRAGLDAVERNNDRLPLPLAFNISTNCGDPPERVSPRMLQTKKP